MFGAESRLKGPVCFKSQKHGRFLKGLLWLFLLLATLSGSFSDIYGSSNAADSLLQITELYYRGRFTEALVKLGKMVAADPDHDQARLNLACLLKVTGRHREALTHLEYLVNKDPSNLKYRVVLVETAYLAGQPGMAVKYYYPNETDPLIHFWYGLALADLGKIEAAREALTESVRLQPYNPMAYYALGLLEQKSNNLKDAFARFQQALSQEPNLGRSYFPLAKNYFGIQNHKTPYSLLLKAGSTEPWKYPVNFDFQGIAETDFETKAEPTQNSAQIAEIMLPLVTLAENRETIPEIRIGLISKIQRYRVKTGGQYRLSVKGGTQLTGEAGEILLFVRTAKGVEVYNGEGKLLLNTRQEISLSYYDPGATSLIFDARFGNGTYWDKDKLRIYRGIIEAIPKAVGITVVNRVNLEEYLYGVVPAEIPASWPPAVLEAQAIAARTYALANLGKYKIQGFDLSATPTSQVYNGVAQETESVIAAVNSTRGMILLYDGKPAGTFYHDNSGGYSETGAYVWGTDRPYLRALPEKPLSVREQPLTPDELTAWLTSQPECSAFREGYFVRSAYRWTVWITREQLESRIQAKIGKIKAIIPMERGISGRVKRVMIRGTSGSHILSGSDMTYRLGGLRSTLFVVQPKLGRNGYPESFIFNGGGWGHGVGMSQSGAAGMALDGATAPEILAYYYPGTELVTKY